MPPSLRLAPFLLLTVLADSEPGAQSPTSEPVPSELKESIEVRLVTIDVVALDTNDVTVADLTKGDL